MTLFWNKYRVKHITITSYHPQGNGLMEWMNQTIKNIIVKMIQEHGEEWDLFLLSTLFVIQISQQDSTWITSFALTYGREATKPIDQIIWQLKRMTHEETLRYRTNEEIGKLKNLQRQVVEFIGKVQEWQQHNFDKEHKETIPLKISDKVLLY